MNKQPIPKQIHFSNDEEMLIKNMSIEQNVSIEVIKNVVSEYIFNCRKAIGTPRFVVLPISTAHKDPMGRPRIEVEQEIVDITQFVRVKPFKEKSNPINKGKKIGCLLCSEPTGKFGTLIVDGLSVEQVVALYKQSGVSVTI